MKKYSYTRSLRILFVLAFCLATYTHTPFLAHACGNLGEPPCAGTPSTAAGTASQKSGAPSSNSGTPGIEISTGITNPLPGIEDIPSLIATILNFVLVVGVPIVTLAIIYAGFLFVTAQGNEEKLTTAKTTLLYTIIGAALLLGSFVIAQAIKGTVDCLKSETTSC
jgi:Type IV secretion system pilin